MHDDSTPTLMAADHRRLVRAAARLLGPAEAEDAVQDAYIRALETNPAGLDDAQAWLFTVVRHLAIDRLRRRGWMQQWLGAMPAQDPVPSAERAASLAEEVAQVLRLMATHLTPMDGAALLLHAVFEVEHAEIARANHQSEAASRQRLRRALARLRQAGDGPAGDAPRLATAERDAEPDAGEDAVFRQYLDSLRLRDPRSLWAMLRQPPIRAMAPASAVVIACAPSSSVAACGVLQVGGQLGLVLTLDGVSLCVLPLGVRAEQDLETAAA